MENKVELKLSEGGGFVEVLTGIAKDPINPKKQELSGTISAPINFWSQRLKNLGGDEVSSDDISYNKDSTYVEFNYSYQSIKLVVNAAHPSCITVRGSFIINPLFVELKINEPVAYDSHAALLMAIKGKSNIFPSIPVYEDFVKRLKNFVIKVNKEVKVVNDEKGNKEDSEKYSLLNFESIEFELFTPIFVGEEKSLIKIKVEIDIRNSSPIFYLQSNELPVLKEKYMDEKFKEMKELFVDIVKIDK